MNPAHKPLLQLRNAQLPYRRSTDTPPLNLDILPGLTAITGDEGTGKTTLLKVLAGDLTLTAGTLQGADALWLDLRLPEHDALTAEVFWTQWQSRCPRWQADLHNRLCEALGLQAHLGKQLFMLSTGSRRKVALVGLLASGATITCLDQPYDALDLPSVRVVREFLQDMADHSSRAWVVADYVADAALAWRHQIERV